jgi:peptidoglycan/LPS O-acetylase OafA/YrhL
VGAAAHHGRHAADCRRSAGWCNRYVLAQPPLVWVGLISYPLYLWHWPLLSFAHILHSAQPAWQVRGVAVLLAVLLAWLTYRLLEQRAHARP